MEMAEELTLNASLEYEDSEGSSDSLELTNGIANVSSKKFIHHKQTIGTSEEAIVLGEISSPGWAFFINRDSTNYIELKVASSGAIFAKLHPGRIAMLYLGSGGQAPYAVANTAACILEFLIVSQ
jgi:hypothetical protein